MLALALAAVALTGSVADPVDGAGTPAQDIVQARSTFDGDAGTWSLTLRMREAATSADAARIHAILFGEDPASPGVCPGEPANAEIGRIDADTTAAQADGPELTVAMSSPAFVGAHAVCASASLSKGHPLDILDKPIFFEPGFVPPERGPEPTIAAPKIALASRTARVSGRAATLRLKPFSARTSVRVGGRAAHGRRTVDAWRPVKVRVQLTRTARRMLARHRRARVKLTVSALQAGAPRTTRTLKVTLVWPTTKTSRT
jgi:hypothetical protein